MKSFGEQMQDLKYCISKENTAGSRGVYVTYVIVSVILFLAGIAGVVLGIVGQLTGAIRILSFCILPFALIEFFGLMALFSKND